MLNIHGTNSQCGCICACGRWCGFKIFPVSVSVKCSVPNNASLRCIPEVTNFAIARSCYSKDQLWQPVRWGNVQHSLNMSSVFSLVFRLVSTCIIGLLQMILITVMASRIDSFELVLIFSLTWRGSIPSLQGHCWKWCHFMYFSKLDDSFEIRKCPHIQATPGFHLLPLSLLMLLGLECVCVCVCVCVCMHTSMCDTHSVIVN
jgi:hypothetical protein